MTDPFADLERELLAAHARAARPRRLPRPGPRPLAFAATATAAAAAAAVVVWLGGSTDAERAAAPQPPPVLTEEECRPRMWIPPATSAPAPEPIASRLAVLREAPRRAEVDLRIFGAQATRVYGEPVAAGRRGDYDMAVVAADIVPRDRVTRQGRPCDPPPGDTVPGACLHLGEAKGGLGACFTVEELEAGEAFIDADGGIYGLAPDGVRHVTAGGDRSYVDANLFALPGGPETKVAFER